MRIIAIVLLLLSLSSCQFIRYPNIEQGNLISAQSVSQLHKGMSETQVKSIMGDPILVNVFTPNRVEYVYYFNNPYKREYVQKSVSCIFVNHRLQNIQTI